MIPPLRRLLVCRAAPGIPGYRLHKPSGQARVIINGRHVYLGPYDSPESRKKYQEIVRKHLVERTNAEMERAVEFATDVTISEIIVRYIPHVESYYRKHGKPTGQISIIRLSLRVLREKFGHLEATSFGPKALKQCRAEFIRQGLCRNEVNRRTSLIRGFFKWAVSEESAPLLGLAWTASRLGSTEEPQRGPGPRAGRPGLGIGRGRDPPSLASSRRCDGAPPATCGDRPDEVVQMRGRDLVTAGTVWEYTPGSHKTEHHDKGRVIMLGPRARLIVEEWLKTDLEAFLFSPRESVAGQRAERRATRKTPMWESHKAAAGQEAEGPSAASRPRSLRRGELSSRDPSGVRSGIPPPDALPDRG